VESIRFAFDADKAAIRRITKRRERETGKDEGVIPATLGAGSVICNVDEIGEGTVTKYTIQRELDAAPRVLRNGSRDPMAQAALTEIEIYSQGDLQLLAAEDQQQRRLSLVDRTNYDRIAALTGERKKIASELELLGSRLRLLQGDIEQRRLHVRDLAQVRAELDHVLEGRPEMPPSLEQQHNDYLKRQRLLGLMSDLRNIQLQSIAGLNETAELQDEVAKIRERLHSITADNTDTVLPLLNELETQLRSVRDTARSISTIRILEHSTQLASTFESLDEQYHEHRQRQQTVSESLKREDALRRRIEEIEKLQRDLITLNTQRTSLADRRRELRARLLAIRDEIFELRVAETLRINEEFGDIILLAVKRAAYSAAYVQKIVDLIAGSRIRSQDEIARELATHFLPNDLLDIIEAGDAPRVATLLDRDLGQITRVITYLRDHSDLYALEGEYGDDTLEITMFDNGIPKRVEQLSKGQRATALLPLILRGSTAPLIVDQPEDDLDNSFIYQTLVKSIRALKSHRQLIFVTHNANIPVLGEADSVIVMEMATPTKALPPRIGSLDERKQDILDLLEGGKEAFEQREQRYHDLLT
jgi:hypothetical protein